MTVTSPRRWWALAALAMSVLVVAIDLTVLNVALPTLSSSLHASTPQLQWFVDAYNLVLAAALLPAGLLGDRLGRRRVLAVGLVLFAVASAASAYSPSPGALIAARVVLGLGAAIVIPLSLAVLTVLFDSGERPKAVAVVMGATMLGLPLGPVLGGWLLGHYWWGVVFLVNVPVALLAAATVGWLIPESHGAGAPRFDRAGIALSSLGLAGLTYAVIEIGEHGWGNAAGIAALVAGSGLLAGFVLHERRTALPLVDPALVRSARFRWGAVLATLVTFAMFGLLFAMPLYFQAVRGTDALGAGLRLMPLIGGILVGGTAASRLLTPRPDRPTLLRARPIVAAGFGLLAAGLFLGATTGTGTPTTFAALWLAVAGTGVGLALPAAMELALSALTEADSGVGSAAIMALRQVGGTIGVALLGAVLNSTYRNGLTLPGAPAPVREAARDSVTAGIAAAERLGSGPLLASVRTAFVHSMDTMLLACAGIAVLAGILAVLVLPRRPASPAARPAEVSRPGGDAVAAR
jgi:EmrB/QacA subfamily drug resistance transporter